MLEFSHNKTKENKPMTTTFSKSTIHSIDRAKERAGINERKAEKMITLALERGKTYEDFTSWERNYLQNEAYGDCKAIAFNGYCYIVNADGFCVTLYKLPSWFGKKKHYDGKDRIRDYKKYCKSNNLYQ